MDEDGLEWARETARQIVAKHYGGMGVTYSPSGEYTDSIDILPPLAFPVKLEPPPMSWRVAKSLLTLRDQVDARWPNRDKSSDGTIGDEAHQATKSDHNPDSEGVVRAMDITHDPGRGLSARALAETLVASRDPRIKYIISNAQIISSQVSPWVWRPYNGTNAHSEHVHISVVSDDALADDTRLWAIDGAIDTVPSPVLSSGKGSWYSQYIGKYTWVDIGDKPNSNALGVPDDAQGISLYNRDTLGSWFLVEAPNGKKLIAQQTDIGPAPSTGRLIDIAAVLAELFGYTPKNFPTDGIFKWRPAPPPVGGTPKEQAIKFRDIRFSVSPPPPSSDVDAAIARLDAVVADLKARVSNLEKKPMPDTTQPQPQQVDWAAIMKAIEILAPQIPKILSVLQMLAPLISVFSGRAPMAFVQSQPQGLAAMPGGSWVTIISAIATAVLGAAQSKGMNIPTEAILATGGATLAGGGYMAKDATTKK